MLLIFHRITLPVPYTHFTKQHKHSVGIFIETILVFNKYLIPLFHTGPELTRIDKYLDSLLNRTQFVKILTDSHSP